MRNKTTFFIIAMIFYFFEGGTILFFRVILLDTDKIQFLRKKVSQENRIFAPSKKKQRAISMSAQMSYLKSEIVITRIQSRNLTKNAGQR